MALISAVRSQLPLPPTPPQPTQESPPRAAGGPVPAVANPMRADALRQPAETAALVTLSLAERDESDHPAAAARAASEAARDAYVRASLAAGVSPLPLPEF